VQEATARELHVVAEGVDRFKVKGGSGQSLTEEWCHVFTVRGGKVVAFMEYIDTAGHATRPPAGPCSPADTALRIVAGSHLTRRQHVTMVIYDHGHY
jgi:hypothetical protein